MLAVRHPSRKRIGIGVGALIGIQDLIDIPAIRWIRVAPIDMRENLEESSFFRDHQMLSTYAGKIEAGGEDMPHALEKLEDGDEDLSVVFGGLFFCYNSVQVLLNSDRTG